MTSKRKKFASKNFFLFFRHFSVVNFKSLFSCKALFLKDGVNETGKKWIGKLPLFCHLKISITVQKYKSCPEIRLTAKKQPNSVSCFFFFVSKNLKNDHFSFIFFVKTIFFFSCRQKILGKKTGKTNEITAAPKNTAVTAMITKSSKQFALYRLIFKEIKIELLFSLLLVFFCQVIRENSDH